MNHDRRLKIPESDRLGQGWHETSVLADFSTQIANWVAIKYQNFEGDRRWQACGLENW